MRVWVAYALMRAKVRLTYRGDLLFNAIGNVLSTSVGLLAVLTLFTHVPDVSGYSAGEMVLCWGMAEACMGAYWIVFQGLYSMNLLYVVQGHLDRVLLRPLHPLVQILLDHLNIDALPVLGLGLVMIGVGAWQIGTPWTPLQVVLLPVFIASGALVIGGVLTGISALGFWTTHRGTAVGLAHRATLFAKYPLEVFPRWLAVLVLGVTPFSFAGFVPATFYMDRPEWVAWAWVQPLVGPLCMGVGASFWSWSARRYSSTGT